MRIKHKAAYSLVVSGYIIFSVLLMSGLALIIPEMESIVAEVFFLSVIGYFAAFPLSLGLMYVLSKPFKNMVSINRKMEHD